MDHSMAVGRLVTSCSDLLSQPGLREVRHFLEHGEYEMAFEGLVLELMTTDRTPPDFSGREWLALGEQLGLRTESVFVADFWPRFCEWVGRGSP